MSIDDRIYGRITIDEPVIAELIRSRPMQRLKHISQDGAPHFIQPVRNVSRFEHSVGVWYLSHRYRRPIEEQIASLLHDIPHTAFSHVIDVVMNDADNAYHDKFTKQVILASEIPGICARHNVSIDKVLDKENYQLLENDLPDVSVDRWDYFMRDGYTFGVLPVETVRLFLSSMKEADQTFYFDDRRVASLFAIMYLNCSRLIWLDPTSYGSFQLLARALNEAAKKGILAHDDFFRTDEAVLKLLREAHDEVLDALLARLSPGADFMYAAERDAEFFGASKARYVDPFVMQGDNLIRVSELVPGMADYFKEYRSRYSSIGVRQKLENQMPAPDPALHRAEKQ